jgi:16S rRNA (cytosine1402-N4)-methyltransferase
VADEGPGTIEGFSHRPVMVAEVVEVFDPVPEGLLVDATVGGGGHARALLERHPGRRVLGIDRDAEAIGAAREALALFEDRAELVHAGFEDLERVVDGRAVAGALFDLGVSSPQLDRPERGFSYRAEAPLDMRMDRSQAFSAREVVNEYEETELARVIRQWGEERFARAIARRIVSRRPLQTTGELSEAVRDAIPAPARRRGGHPARRTFQAIRMEVNAELDHLDRGLDAAIAVLVPGGRLAVLSYHSLEDRLVKQRFALWSAAEALPPGTPLPPVPLESQARVRLVTRRALRPSASEKAENPRAESARLRAIEAIS